MNEEFKHVYYYENHKLIIKHGMWVDEFLKGIGTDNFKWEFFGSIFFRYEKDLLFFKLRLGG